MIADLNPVSATAITLIAAPAERVDLLARAAREFLAGRPKSTALTYQGRIAQFNAWRDEQPPQSLVSLLSNYVSYLRDERGLAASTIQGHLGIVKGVIRRASMIDPDNDMLLRALPHLDLVKPPVQRGEFQGIRLSAEQMQALINTPKTDTAKGLRDTAILGLLGVLGMRRAEVCNLMWGHIASIDGVMCIANLKSKHGRVRTMKLPDWLHAVIIQWGAVSKRDTTNPTTRIFCPVTRASFVLSTRVGLTTHAVYKMLESRCLEAGIPVVRPHDLRRTAACLARKGGATIEQVQMLLGHESPQTTSHYIGESLDLDDHAVDYSPIKVQS